MSKQYKKYKITYWTIKITIIILLGIIGANKGSTYISFLTATILFLKTFKVKETTKITHKNNEKIKTKFFSKQNPEIQFISQLAKVEELNNEEGVRIKGKSFHFINYTLKYVFEPEKNQITVKHNGKQFLEIKIKENKEGITITHQGHKSSFFKIMIAPIRTHYYRKFLEKNQYKIQKINRKYQITLPTR